MVTSILPVRQSPYTPIMSFLKPIREHLDLIASTVSTIANTLYLAGKLFSSVPVMVMRSAFVAVNTVGFLFLDWQISFTLKTAKDCSVAMCLRSWKRFMLAAISTISAVSDLFLMLGGLAASIALWMQRPAVSAALYTVMRPWGVLFLFVAITLDVSYYYANRHLVQQLDAVGHSRATSEHARNILRVLSTQSAEGIPRQDTLLAVSIRCTMDKYTLEKLLEKVNASTISKQTSLVLLRQIRANVATQLESDGNNLGLRALGYIGLFLCKAYPDSLVQATTLFVTSLLYTANRADKKFQESVQRSAIQHA